MDKKKQKEQVQVQHPGIIDRIKSDWKIYLLAFVFIVIADSIGQIKIPFLKGTFIIFPIFFAIILGVLSGPEVLKIIDDKRVHSASKLVIVCILPFIAKLGINAGANLSIVFSAGPALVLQEIGNLMTIFLAMPVALLLGLKREAIGATHSINRETNLALMQDMFGAESPEARGSLSVYIVGGMIGTIYFGFMASFIASFEIFHPYSLGIASGVGAGIMMASAVASLGEIYPAMAGELSALASTAETIAGITGIYLAIFVAVPITKWLYRKLEPTLGRVTKAGRKAAAEYEAEGTLMPTERDSIEGEIKEDADTSAKNMSPELEG